MAGQPVADGDGAVGVVTCHRIRPHLLQRFLAHRLYRAIGFVECELHPETEGPPEFDVRWLYMTRGLTADRPTATPWSTPRRSRPHRGG